MTTLRNASAAELAAAGAAANSAANPSRVKTRTCSLPANIVEQIVSSPEGIYEDDGGAVCNSYGYRAETSYVIAAWYTHPSGEKHVRIEGKRVQARSAARGCGNGCSHVSSAGWTAVYPERAAKLHFAAIERARKAIRRVGEDGADDRLQVMSPRIVAVSDEGLLVADNPERPSTVQVIVRDATTGQRHHITVPPKFAHPERKTYQQIVAKSGKAGLVHAAIAWTFSLAPEQYQPTVQA